MKNLNLERIIKLIDNKYEVYICGSFRRKKDFCGDIDVLITHPNLDRVKLEEENFILKQDMKSNT